MTKKQEIESSDARFHRLWLDEKSPYETRCMWQEKGPEHTQIEKMECWLWKDTLYIIQFWRNNGGFVVFKQERE